MTCEMPNCQHEAIPCYLPGAGPTPSEYLCGACAVKAGYCCGCGLFIAGSDERFDSGLSCCCENCRADAGDEQDDAAVDE